MAVHSTICQIICLATVGPSIVFNIEKICQDFSFVQYYKGKVTFKFTGITLCLTRKGFLKLHLTQPYINEHLSTLRITILHFLKLVSPYASHRICAVHVSLSNLNVKIIFHSEKRTHDLLQALISKVVGCVDIFVKEGLCSETPFIKYNNRMNVELIKVVRFKSLTNSTNVLTWNSNSNTISIITKSIEWIQWWERLLDDTV